MSNEILGFFYQGTSIQIISKWKANAIKINIANNRTSKVVGSKSVLIPWKTQNGTIN